MKVFELLTPDQLKYKQLKSPISKKWNTLNKSSDARPMVGGGAFASAYAPEKLPGEIEKIAKPDNLKSLSKDGYYQYLDMISRNERISNNPFFPKVFSLKTFKGSDGKYTYKANIEKLHALGTLSTEEALMIGRSLFTTFDAKLKQTKKIHRIGTQDADSHYYSMRTDKEKEELIHDLTIDTLAEMFNDVIHWSSGVSTNIQNTHLKQALMLIRKMIKSDETMAPDIHRGNIMVRRGPFTPQIVITDPVS